MRGLGPEYLVYSTGLGSYLWWLHALFLRFSGWQPGTLLKLKSSVVQTVVSVRGAVVVVYEENKVCLHYFFTIQVSQTSYFH